MICYVRSAFEFENWSQRYLKEARYTLAPHEDLGGQRKAAPPRQRTPVQAHSSAETGP